MRRMAAKGFTLLVLAALIINLQAACAASQDIENPIEFGYAQGDYVETFSGFKSSSDAECLAYADAFLDGTLYVSELFEGAPFERIDEIDWDMTVTESPNTFQLYLQGLTPLETLGRAWNQTKDLRYLEAGKELIESWNLYRQKQSALADAGGGNSLLWHDHGTAIRAESLLYFLLACMDTPLDTPELRGEVQELLILHAQFLADDSHYTENHNHGIIQDVALLHTAYFLRMPESQQWISIAEDRLEKQKEYAFNSEMVHVENSPGYNAAVIDSFYQIAIFLQRMGDSFSEHLLADIYDAAEFLAWVTLPNGITAQIGDTSSSLKQEVSSLKYEHFGNPRLDFASSLGQKDEMTPEQKAEVSKVYPDAGYYFYRENWDGETVSDATWKMLKSGYSSRTHKHADDCSFILYSKGYEVFSDTGWYNYMSGTPYRTYFISSSAHNTVTVDEKSYSPTAENAGKAEILSYETADQLDYVLAHNDMYNGVEFDRHFWSSGDLTVLYDNMISDETHTYSQLFHLSEHMKIVSAAENETVLQIADTEYLVRIRQMRPTALEVYHGRSDAQPLYGHISRSINQVAESDTLRYTQAGAQADYITVITIEDKNGMVALKNGVEIHYTDILYDAEKQTIEFEGQTLDCQPRARFYPDARVTVTADGQVSAEAKPFENCLYAWYLINAQTGEAFYKSEFSEENLLNEPLSGQNVGADLLVKCYVRSAQYPQRKSAIVAALVYDAAAGTYRVDDGTKYKYLNLEYHGQKCEKTGANTYRFEIDYDYSWNSTQRWYVYRNGAYYTVMATKNERALTYTFTEPGSYTVSYYLRTANGDCEFWDFDAIEIEA